jgi:hypothetical protein
MTPKSRAHPALFFPKFARHFGGFRDFQLRIEVKFRKRRFSIFGKIFTFAFYRWRSTAPFFTWGENLNFAFFEKCGTRFRFWVRFVLFYSRKSVRTKMTTPTDYPIAPVGGSVFLTLLFRFPAVKWRQKKSERFCSTII